MVWIYLASMILWWGLKAVLFLGMSWKQLRHIVMAKYQQKTTPPPNNEEIMTEKMTNEERAVFIGERLLGIKVGFLQKGFGTHVTIITKGTVVPPMPKYDVIDLYSFWSGDEEGKKKNEDSHPFKFFTRWISSPDGIHAVKAAMIERGFIITITLDPTDIVSKAKCWIWSNNELYMSYKDDEAEAVLAATYKALRAEDDQ